MTAALATPIGIDVVSDVVCPWCFVGKRRLGRALELIPEIPVEVRWHPYQLDPTIPAAGMERAEYLKRKFGGPEEIARLHEPLVAIGREEGINFAFDRITRSPNTLDAHRVIHWAAAEGVQDQVVEQLFRRYFLDGADLSTTSGLADAAAAGGMDRAMVTRLLASGADRQEVSQAVHAAREMGIEGVPAFLVGRRYAVLGAREPEVIAGAIAKVAEELARTNAAPSDRAP